MEYCILVINPGSTSTKIAVFQGEKALLQKTIRHSGEELAPFGAIMDQAPFRLRCVEQALAVVAIQVHVVVVAELIVRTQRQAGGQRDEFVQHAHVNHVGTVGTPHHVIGAVAHGHVQPALGTVEVDVRVAGDVLASAFVNLLAATHAHALDEVAMRVPHG